MDTKQFISALNQIADEKGIPKEKVIETIEMAIAAAYKKDYGERGQIIRAELNAETGAVKMSQVKVVVDESMLKKPGEEGEEGEEQEPIAHTSLGESRDRHGGPAVEGEEVMKKITFNPERHIMPDEAKKIKKDAAVGDEIIFNLEAHSDFGRIAAQTAKQVIIQRLREAEREMVLTEYKAKEGEVVSAQVQRVDWKNIVLDLGRTTGMLYYEEQIPGERYRIGDRMKVYVVKVDVTPKGPVIVLSRSHPAFVKKLFELEVPEVAAGTVEIKSIAREAGSRSKIAVATSQEGVDPIGSCVGQKGTRVSAVISELSGEKIDIIEWSDDAEGLIANALSPAKVLSVEANPETRESRVIVPADQLSLAIGKGGQNVRLAARLTGWKIDVRSPEETKAPAGEEEVTEEAPEITEEVPADEKKK
ncbi:MAG: transcription termination factor NusA [Patescibacteria group bacterium]